VSECLVGKVNCGHYNPPHQTCAARHPEQNSSEWIGDWEVCPFPSKQIIIQSKIEKAWEIYKKKCNWPNMPANEVFIKALEEAGFTDER